MTSVCDSKWSLKVPIKANKGIVQLKISELI